MPRLVSETWFQLDFILIPENVTPALFLIKLSKHGTLATAGGGSAAGADRSSVNDGDQQNLPNKGFFF